jgi:apolipoprotein N-acyltransferase
MFDLFAEFGVVLWLIGSFWTGLFVLLGHGAIGRLGQRGAILLLPMLFIAMEYFRSELYPLKFSWLAPGYTFAGHGQPLLVPLFGVYGVGFMLTLLAAWLVQLEIRRAAWFGVLLLIVLGGAAHFSKELPVMAPAKNEAQGDLLVAAVQLEFPSTSQLIAALDKVVVRHPNVDLVVFSEYTYQGTPPADVLDWCRQNTCYLIAGGKEAIEGRGGEFRNTVFVVSPDGQVVFKQAKSVPIQFFADGLPAEEQRVWDSPWGKIGICICYDLSYTRVVDELVRQGAQLLIVPTMDVESWGDHEHRLHAKVAPTRAAEYGLPIVRVCSSGISQVVTARGHVTHSLPYPGQGESFTARVQPVGNARIPVDRILAPIGLLVSVLFVGFLVLEAVFKPIQSARVAAAVRREALAGLDH